MAGDHSLQDPFASGSWQFPTLDRLLCLSDGTLFDSPGVGAEFGLSDPGPQFVGATATPLHPGPEAPEAACTTDILVRLAAEDPTDPSKDWLSSEYGPGFVSSAGDYSAVDDGLPGTSGSLQPVVLASDTSHVPATTHHAGSSSGYGASQVVSPGPPVSASTGEAQEDPSAGLRIFHSRRYEQRSTEWRSEVQHLYSIEISQHCLGSELWSKWNGRLYINQSTYDDADALYLRLDAQISDSGTIAPFGMCAKCQGAEKKPYPHKRAQKGGPKSPQVSDLSRIYCNWPLDLLVRTDDFFEGEISFYIFCHPSHAAKKSSLQTFRIIATLYKADTTALGSCTLAEEFISRTTARNNTTVRSRSNVRKPLSLRAASPVPITVHLVSDHGEAEDNRPDPLESTSRLAHQLNIPGPSIEVAGPLPTLASVPPIASLVAETHSTSLFNGIDPNRGYGGQNIRFYGCVFSPTVDYYAKFGELEPIPVTYRNAGLLEGEVPENHKTGQVSVSITNQEGYTLCHNMRRFVYIDRDRKNAEEDIIRAYDRVDPEDARRDANDASRRLKDSKRGNGAFGSSIQEQGTQARQCGIASGGETGAQDEMSTTLNILEPIPEQVDRSMQGLTNQGENANIEPRFLPPSRSWTDASAATTAVATSWGTAATFKTIKAFSRKPPSRSIVSQWLGSNYGSESSWKRKRTRENMETEVSVGQSGVGGSVLRSTNLLLSPEQEKFIDGASFADEDSPVILMNGHSDPPAARAPKRRRVEAPLLPLASTFSGPLTLPCYEGC